MNFLQKVPLVFAFFLIGFNLDVFAQQEEPIAIDLVSSVESVLPGDIFTAALRVRMESGWHTYWINPGDSGAMPRVSWTPQKGVFIGELNFPVPERIEYGDLVNFGYKTETVWPFEISIENDFSEDSVRIFAEIDILVCSDICIPKKLTVNRKFQVGDTKRDDEGSKIILTAFDSMPIKSALAPLAELKSDNINLKFSLAGDLASKASTDAFFFPFDPNLIDNKSKQHLFVSEDKLVLSINKAQDYIESLPISGILKIDGSAYAINPTISYSEQGFVGPKPATLLTAILLAFVGGFLLNLMPCVFPVLSIKVLSLINHSNESKISLVYSFRFMWMEYNYDNGWIFFC